MVLVACCVLAGCRSGEEPPAAEGERAASAGSTDSVFTAAEDRVSLPGDRIYFTLTSHEWYARGEPLLYEGRQYRPAGMPVAASLTEMERAGDFQGVEFYRRSGDTQATVYVPVYEGYWQIFRTDAEVIDTTMTAPPPADPDTISGR